MDSNSSNQKQNHNQVSSTGVVNVEITPYESTSSLITNNNNNKSRILFITDLPEKEEAEEGTAKFIKNNNNNKSNYSSATKEEVSRDLCVINNCQSEELVSTYSSSASPYQDCERPKDVAEEHIYSVVRKTKKTIQEGEVSSDQVSVASRGETSGLKLINSNLINSLTPSSSSCQSSSSLLITSSTDPLVSRVSSTPSSSSSSSIILSSNQSNHQQHHYCSVQSSGRDANHYDTIVDAKEEEEEETDTCSCSGSTCTNCTCSDICSVISEDNYNYCNNCIRETPSGNNQRKEDSLLITLSIPHLHYKDLISVPEHQLIWSIKLRVIELIKSLKLQENSLNLFEAKDNKKAKDCKEADDTCDYLNYGFYCPEILTFLEEESSLINVFSNYYYKQKSHSSSASVFCVNCLRKKVILLEFIPKIRTNIVTPNTNTVIMSVVSNQSSTSTITPSAVSTSSVTRKKKKRGKLMDAVTNGNVEKIIKLVVNCDPNFIDEPSGETPLSHVTNLSSLSATTIQRVIVALVNGGCHLDLRCKEGGRTALHVAVMRSNYVALKTYLDLGASPNYKDSNGLTPLYYSILHKSNPKITQLLLYERSIHGVTDTNGWREIHHAAKLGLTSHIEQLIFYGADMDVKITVDTTGGGTSGGSGNTALHVAAINDQREVIKLLLKRGCSREIVNHSHQNAYQVAVIANNLDASELIKNFNPANISGYRDKPKFNPNRKVAMIPNSQSSDVLGGSRSGIPSGHQQQQMMRNVNASSSSASPCPSNTTTTSSGVCCSDYSTSGHCSCHSSNHSGGNNMMSTSMYQPIGLRNGNIGTTSRVEGRREQKNGMMTPSSSSASCCSTLPNRSRLQQQQQQQLFTPGQMTAGHQQQQLMKQDSLNSTTSTVSSSSCSNSDNNVESRQKHQTITSYNEKTVSLHRGNKGFGFVLRGAKATSPAVVHGPGGLRLPSLIEPISLQYLDEIEEGGVAQMAGLAAGDFLLNVNGVDVRMAPHETVVTLIRSSGDKVTMSVASPIYMKLDETDEDVAAEKLKKKMEKRKQKMISSASNSTSGSDVAPQNIVSNVPESESNSSMGDNDHGSDTGTRGRSRMPPPAPPKRDPSTTLSVGRARARSLCIGNGQENGLELDDHRRNSSDTNSTNGSNHHQQQMEQEENHYQRPSIQPIPIDRTKDEPKDDKDNTATIRSRGTRRMSALELEEFFQRQDETSSPFIGKNGDSGTNGYKKNDVRGTQTLKVRGKQKNKNSKDVLAKDDERSSSSMGRKTLSASDMQELLHLESSNCIKTIMDGKNGTGLNRLARSSQENLNYFINKQCPETVTLKNGKIVNGSSQPEDVGGKSSPRVPPPSHPPPPVPPIGPNGQPVQSTVTIKPTIIKVETRESDYANFDEIKDVGDIKVSKNNSVGLSSFRAPAPDPVDGSNDVTDTSSAQTSSITQTPASKGILKKSVKIVTSTGSTNGKPSNVSIYSRSESNEDSSSISISTNKKIVSTAKDGSKKTPFIPDPDYSTSEDETTIVNDAPGTSTFKDAPATVTVPLKDAQQQQQTMRSATKESPSKLRQRSASSDSTCSLPPPPPPLALEEDFDITSTESGESPNKTVPCPQTTSTAEETSSANKVKLYARQFERRSSITSSVGSSSDGGQSSSPAGSLGVSSGKKMVSSVTNYDSGTDNNSSSGISSDVDATPSSASSFDKKKMLISNPNYAENRNAVVAAMNRKNNTSTLPSSMSSKSSTMTSSLIVSSGPKTLPKPEGKRVSFEDTKISSAAPLSSSASSSSASTAVTASSAASVSASKSAPKTWSEISSAIKAAKVGMSPSNSVQSPTKTPSQCIKNNSQRDTSSDRLQRSKDGLINEVDVLAQLVPPPPEFAAPPPHLLGHQQQQQKMNHKIQVQIKSSADGQQHIVQKPMVAKPTTTANHINTIQINSSNHEQQQVPNQHLSRIHTVDPVLEQQQQLYQQKQVLQQQPQPSSASARLGITLTQQQAAAYRLMTPQQQAQYTYHLQQQQRQVQLNQQQFATLTRGSSVPRNATMSMSMSASGQQQHQMEGMVNGGQQQQQTYGHHQQQQQQQFVSASQQGYQQFATLSRAGQKAAAQQQQMQAAGASNVQMTNSLYNDYNRLSVQQRLQRSTINSSPNPLSMSTGQQQHHHPQPVPSITTISLSNAGLSSQQLQSLTPLQRQQLLQRLHVQQQQQQLYVQQQLAAQQQQQQQLSNSMSMSSHGKTHPAPLPPTTTVKHQPVTFPRKLMSEWSTDDVADWLTSIGMSDYRNNLSSLNGSKLIKIDPNDLTTSFGIRSNQHKSYLIEKVKQYLDYQSQHPPNNQQQSSGTGLTMTRI